MKRLLLALIFIPIISIGQGISNEVFTESTKKWVSISEGNPIDGNTRSAFRTVSEDSGDLFFLKVINNANSLKIENSSLGEGDNRDDVLIEMRSNTFTDLKEVLLYFNNEQPFYRVNYLKYSESGFIWHNAVANKEKGFMTKFDFINNLKVKNKVTFRFKYSNKEDKNISFTLNGSTAAINKTVDLSAINLYENDWKMDAVMGVLRLNWILEDDKLQNDLLKLDISTDSLRILINDYLFNELGKYYHAIILKYVYDEEPNILDVYDINKKVLSINLFEDLGVFTTKSTQCSKDIAEYNRIIELDSKLVGTYFKRGLVKKDCEDYNGAIKDFTVFLEYYQTLTIQSTEFTIDDIYNAYHSRGISKIYIKDYAGAISDFNKVIESSTNSNAIALAYYFRGIAKYNSGNTTGCCADLKYSQKLGLDTSKSIIKYCN